MLIFLRSHINKYDYLKPGAYVDTWDRGARYLILKLAC